jgi:hypothetical protein
MKRFFKSFVRLISPELAVGGLEIGEGGVRYMALAEDGAILRQANAPLAAGAIVQGKVADMSAVIAALRAVRRGARLGGRATPVIVSLPSQAVYAQAFEVPRIGGARLEEAAQVNLRMICPIEGPHYADWELVQGAGDAGAPGMQDALGAFAEAAIIDAYTACLKEAGFFAAAIEYAALSLTRVVVQSALMQAEEPFMLVSAGSDGLSLAAVRGASPYVTRFMPWRELPQAQFGDIAGKEIRRMAYFYGGKWGKPLARAVVASMLPNAELAEWIKKTFGFEVFAVSGYGQAGREWLVAAGAAMRGLVPRAEDKLISLAHVGTEEEFMRAKIMRVIRLWRAVALAAMSLSLAAYGAFDAALVRAGRQAANELRAIGEPAAQEVGGLAARAASFNMLVAKVKKARDATRPVAQDMAVIAEAAGASVTITRLAAQAATRTIAIAGTAANEAAVIAFKSAIAQNARVEKADFPLSVITTDVSGKAAFSATIVFK